MNKHFEIIKEMCKVFAVKGDWAIWYEDGGVMYAEINGASFWCNSAEEFEELCEEFANEDFRE